LAVVLFFVLAGSAGAIRVVCAAWFVDAAVHSVQEKPVTGRASGPSLCS
jgi:hypothetical protein